ncbi:ATP-binding protein [Cytobacillus firmus]|uniref:ATP-binding protein n=1 Tax=Cytobacillus firmus TaxID=1399 RepID=UPI002079E91C|nr:ATP-binding protein [Cytobacillus firmus]USK40149.1 ATP-binding protein [Cytobacillus firmus]
MQNRPLEKQKKPGEHGADNFNCSACHDTEFILYKNDDGYDVARPCDCRERNAWKRRFKNSMIPDEFTNANFENFQRNSSTQESMYQSAFDYLKLFKVEKDSEGRKKKIIPPNNFGFVAVFGEQRLKELPSSERPSVKQRHNNFGIGKTHLQISLAKRLIKDGFNAVVVSDVVFMEQLMQAKKISDEGESYNQLLRNVLNADVLLWDDIGKVNWTEARERMYYTIINERYRMQRPIVFNSNEDRGTLAEKIGYAAASRLIGQADGFLLETEGADWRLKKGAKAHV